MSIESIFKVILINVLTAAGAVSATGTAPVVSYSAPDSSATELRGIVVSTPLSRRVVRIGSDGMITLSATALAEQPSFMGSGDAVSLLRSLPYVATASDLQAAVSVRGGSGGDNLFETDGVRVVNPMHMFGFYSAFNPAFYKDYGFRAGRFDPLMASCTGGYFAARSIDEPDSEISGTLSLGIIESHGAVALPLKKNRFSVKIGLRHNYISKTFPGLLTLGESKLGYEFSDVNAAAAWRPDSLNLFNLTFFGSRDEMRTKGGSEAVQKGSFRWSNICAGLSWQHRQVRTSLALSRYANNFLLSEGGMRLDMPSGLTQLTARAAMPLGAFEVSADINYRYSSGQYNRAMAGSTASPTRAGEGSVAARYAVRLSHGFGIDAGLRLTAYRCGGFSALRPQPRLTVSKNVGPAQIFASYSRLNRFDALVEESTSSLPADFWVNAGADNPPVDVHSFETGAAGYIEAADLRFVVEGYWRRLLHAVDYDGSILDLLNSGFRPEENILDGRGYSAGLSVAALRQWGRLRGRLSYNLGVARLKFDKYGDRYFAAPHDRLHDLSVSVSYDIRSNFTAAATFVHATGNPFTEARFGYMVGENLICEYFPHNSSRLPAYNRLDIALTWRPSRHSTLNMSVYNAAASHNVLFQYTTYKENIGIITRHSTMKAVIPSLSYVYTF